MKKRTFSYRKIKPRVKLIVVKDNRLLTVFSSEENVYYFPGTKIRFGESLTQATIRKLNEKYGELIKFEFEKVLYIRDYINTNKDIHTIEMYLLGTVNIFDELEGKIDPEFEGSRWTTWVNIEDLPDNLSPKRIREKLKESYRLGFPRESEYLREVE